MSVLPLCLDLSLRSSGRSPFKVVVVCRRCVLRASQRTLRETGATRAACAAQNRARQFRVKRVCSEVAALGFPPLAGVAPDPLREGQHRARSTGDTGACLASRGLRLFSRQLGLYEDAAGAICAGRENRSPVHWGRVGTLQARGRTTGAARSVFGGAKQSRRIAVGESRRSIGGRIVRE